MTMRKIKKKKEFIEFLVEQSIKGIAYSTILAYLEDYNLTIIDLHDCMEKAKEQGMYISHKTLFDGNYYLNNLTKKKNN